MENSDPIYHTTEGAEDDTTEGEDDDKREDEDEGPPLGLLSQSTIESQVQCAIFYPIQVLELWEMLR